MKNIYIICLCITFGTFCNGQVQKLVNVTPGGLSASLSDLKPTIKSLTITGSIDARDFKCMRDTLPSLEILDLSLVSINSYNGVNGTNQYITSYASNNIPDWAFCTSTYDGKKSLKTVILPNNITAISQHAFDYCSGIQYISIPDAVTSIGEYAFRSCSGATDLKLGKSVKSIGKSAFSLCRGLLSIQIPESVISIGEIAFSGCSSVVSLNLSNYLTRIEGFTFQDCNSLISITLPNAVNYIGTRAFGGCTGLKSIYCKRTTPIDLTNSLEVFRYLNKSACRLYVPIGSTPLYQDAIQWKDFIITEIEMLAVSVLYSESFFLYPNPVKDFFQINGLEETCFVTISDLNGRIALLKKILHNEKISIQNLPSGVYILKINSKNGQLKKKLIKI